MSRRGPKSLEDTKPQSFAEIYEELKRQPLTGVEVSTYDQMVGFFRYRSLLGAAGQLSIGIVYRAESEEAEARPFKEEIFQGKAANFGEEFQNTMIATWLAAAERADELKTALPEVPNIRLADGQSQPITIEKLEAMRLEAQRRQIQPVVLYPELEAHPSAV